MTRKVEGLACECGARTRLEHDPDFVEDLLDDQYAQEKAKDDLVFVQHVLGDDDVHRPLDGVREIEVVEQGRVEKAERTGQVGFGSELEDVGSGRRLAGLIECAVENATYGCGVVDRSGIVVRQENLGDLRAEGHTESTGGEKVVRAKIVQMIE